MIWGAENLHISLFWQYPSPISVREGNILAFQFRIEERHSLNKHFSHSYERLVTPSPFLSVNQNKEIASTIFKNVLHLTT